MAIRDLLSLHGKWMAAVGVAASVIGCAAQPNAKTTASVPAPAASMFRAPSEIRPADLGVKPALSAVVVAPAESYQPKGPVTAWSPRVKPRPWKYIVIHHSATSNGNAAKFDREHKAKGWDELGYHFVIDNGNGGPDGKIEIGPRWPKQKWGAHAKTPDNRFNEFGIGVCFVGNFQDAKPTIKQMQSGARLVAWLMQTYNIPAGNVIGHDDTKSTLCPGRHLNLAQFRSLANRALADAGSDIDQLAVDPSGETDAAPVNAGFASTEAEIELLKN